MAGYLTLAQFKARTVMPPARVDQLEVDRPGYIDQQLEDWSRWLDAPLRKRYDAPFDSPYPKAVQAWLARLVTLFAYMGLGFDPTDAQGSLYEKDHDAAKAEILEAASAIDNPWDLPLKDSEKATGISKGATRGYSESSPYVAFDQQSATGRQEDSNRGGTNV